MARQRENQTILPADKTLKGLSEEERYSPNTVYVWGRIRFTLSRPEVTEDDVRLLLMKIVECAVRDYINLATPKTALERLNFATAEAFLFEDEYLINFGGTELSLERILELVGDLDVDWLRRKVLELARAKKGTQIADMENPLELLVVSDGTQ